MTSTSTVQDRKNRLNSEQHTMQRTDQMVSVGFMGHAAAGGTTTAATMLERRTTQSPLITSLELPVLIGNILQRLQGSSSGGNTR